MEWKMFGVSSFFRTFGHLWEWGEIIILDEWDETARLKLSIDLMWVITSQMTEMTGVKKRLP